MAYDRIMDFPGHFSDHILPDKIHVLNVCFQVNGMRKIRRHSRQHRLRAHSDGRKPLICATIGHDYQKYFKWLAKTEFLQKASNYCRRIHSRRLHHHRPR